MTYWRNLSLVFFGTVIAQALPVIGSLILTRQFLPAVVGTYSAWLGITLFLSVCLTGRFETSLPMHPYLDEDRVSHVTKAIAALGFEGYKEQSNVGPR